MGNYEDDEELEYTVVDDDFEDWTSNNKEHSTISEYTWTIQAPSDDTRLSFDYVVSSESDCDVLLVYLDGDEFLNVSGEVSDSYTVNLGEGTHTLRAVYSKDGSVSNGQDQATVSNIALAVRGGEMDEEQLQAYVEECVYIYQVKVAQLTGYDALQAELQAFGAAFAEMARQGASSAEVRQQSKQLDVHYAEAQHLVEACEVLAQSVGASEELVLVTGSSLLEAALADAHSLIQAKASLTLQSLSQIASAQQAIEQAIDEMGLMETKVWNFQFGEETVAGLLRDSQTAGYWSDNGGRFYKSYNTASYQWVQLSYCINANTGEMRIIPETEGLFFYNGGYRWYLYTDGSARIYPSSYGTGYAIMIPNAKAGQTLTVNYTNSSGGYLGGIRPNSSNLMYTDGAEQTYDNTPTDVVYEVIEDGDAIIYPYNRSVYINSISITRESAALRLSTLRAEVAAFLPTLSETPGLQTQLRAAYDQAVVLGEETDVEAVISSLQAVYEEVQKAVECYALILSDIAEAQEILAEGAYVEISEAVAQAQAIDVNTASVEVYNAAFDALETALAIYHSDQTDMSSWNYENGELITIGEMCYRLDPANLVAAFAGISTTNAQIEDINIPSCIRVEGQTYAVVAIANAYRKTQSNVRRIQLPKTIRKVDDYGLAYYPNLSSVELPSGVTTMGNRVFYSSDKVRQIKMNSVLPPTVTSLSLGNRVKVTIPRESFHAYRLADAWRDFLLIGGDEGVTISTGRISAGDLGHVVIDEAGYIQEVNKLIIDEGTMSADDWNTIRSMSNLTEIDLSGVTMTTLPSYIFNNRWALDKVVLPHNLSRIEGDAFSNSGIREITLPETLTTLGSSAFASCDSLRSVTIPSQVSAIPSRCFEGCEKLQQVVLPSTITTIGENAFDGCTSLSDVTLPASLTSLGQSAFSSCPIKEIDIPAGLTTISQYAFSNNMALEHLVIPANVLSVGSYAFQSAGSLQTLQLCEGLVEIREQAFGYCRKLTEVVLPSSLEKCMSAPFADCTSLKHFESRSVIPPTTGGAYPLGYNNDSKVVLYVPTWSTTEYQLADGWSSFNTIETTDFLPQYIKVNKDFYFTLRDAVDNSYRPNISMTYSDIMSSDTYGYSNYERGNLTISARSKLAVNDLDLVVSPFAKYYSDQNITYYSHDYRTMLNPTSLMVNGEMRAENVTLKLCNYDERWQFVTFPFDVKVSDIVPQSDNTSWVIRGHNSAMRAAGRTDAVWENLSADDVLEAGKGYIMHCTTPENVKMGYDSYNASWFDVSPLKTTVNRQNIFLSGDRTIALEEHLAEFDHNRSWNLIGNPYPCYFDTRFMDFDAPFLVWNSYTQTYDAYHPADDEYILSPGEAFFLQRPYDQEAITFYSEGRQNHMYAREMEVYARRRAKAHSGRTLFNLTFQQGQYVDRTRIVFNAEATSAYEMHRDVAKLASAERSVPQLFTISGATRYAINERPLADGEVALGVYCGTEGEYTLSLDQLHDCRVMLEDKQAHKTVELTPGEGYTFSATAGEYLNRFLLHFQGDTDAIEMVQNNDKTGARYNLQGVRVTDTNAHGIYIERGQKKIVK